MADISKIVVPALDGSPGGLYNIKDTVAREMLSGGINYFISWKGSSTPVVANIPDTVAIRYNNTVYQGTLTATNAAAMTFYLVKEEGGGSDKFMEYVAVTDPDTQTKYWEMIGYAGDSMDSLGSLAYVDDINIEKGLGANVIGEDATLLAQSSSVSFAAHTTSNVLGSNATFTVTDPTFSLTPSKANISLTRSTDVAITNSSTSVLSALDDKVSKTVSFLTSSTTFTRKKISTDTIYGVGAVAATAVDFSSSTKRKLLTDTVVPAKSLSIKGSDLITGNSQKLVTNSYTVVGGTETVSSVTGVTTATLDTDTINKVTAITTDNAANNEWKDTIANLDIHMYSSLTDGSITGADSETLVISFKTLPSLKISTANATYAKGNVVNGSGAATFATNVTSNDVTVATAGNTVTLATGEVSNNGSGSAVLTSLTSSSVTAAQVDTAKRFATGSIASSSTENTNESYGGEVYTSLVGSVDVPTKNSTATSVLVPTLTTATNVASDINVVTSVTTDTEDAYSVIAFETEKVINSVSVSAQPAFSASVTSDANGSVLTGVSISKSTSGSVAVANDYTPVSAITALGAATAAAQSVAFNNKDLKKVALYNDLAIQTEANPVKRYLNFVMPGGGRLAFYKRAGNPTSRDFEYSFDGVNWTDWTEGTVTVGENTYTGMEITLASSDRFYIRNKSATNTGLSSSENSYYRFYFSSNTYAYGNIMSLLCKNPENASLSVKCFANLFAYSRLKSTPDMPATTSAAGCYWAMYQNCDGLEKVSYIALTSLSQYACISMFSGCSLVDEIRCGFTDTSAEACINSWLSNVADIGTLYLPAGTSIQSSKVPANWTIVYTD